MAERTKKRQYTLDYQKANYVSVVFHLRRDTDKEVLEALGKVNNKSQYIRELIRKDLGLK